MPFRSELDAMRERAEGAEAETRRAEAVLDEQAERMHRIAEVESQLEAARAQLREGKRSPYAWLRGSVLSVGIGVVLGGALVAAYVVPTSSAYRESAIRTDAQHRVELRALEEAAEAARTDAAGALGERDDMRTEMRNARAELRTLLLALTPPPQRGAGGIAALLSGPAGAAGAAAALGALGSVARPFGVIPFGRVSSTSGRAPVASGATCEVWTQVGAERCVGQIACEGTTVHSFGCDEATGTRLRSTAASSDYLTVTSEVGGWDVVINAGLDALGPVAPAPVPYPAPVLPFSARPRP